MKKTLLLLAALPLMATSCLDDTSDTKTNQTYRTCNLVSSADGSLPPVVSECVYKVVYNLTDGKLSVSSSEVRFDDAEHKLTTPEVSYGQQTYDGGGSVVKFRINDGARVGDMPVADFSGALTSIIFLDRANWDIPGIDGIHSRALSSHVVFKYSIGDKYTVRTFCRDAMYVGRTVINYAVGESDDSRTFATEDIRYRAVIDVKNDKADIVFYNSRFTAETQKPIPVLLVKGLEVSYRNDGYTLAGNNIMSLSYANGVTTPYEEFDNIMLTTVSDNLTQVKIAYEIGGGKYKGTFEGRSSQL